MKNKNRVKAILDEILAQEKALEPILNSVCPNWWHCRGQQVENGYIDTFACKKHHACEVIMIKPYTMDELETGLRRVCKSANTEEECEIFSRRGGCSAD